MQPCNTYMPSYQVHKSGGRRSLNLACMRVNPIPFWFLSSRFCSQKKNHEQVNQQGGNAICFLRINTPKTPKCPPRTTNTSFSVPRLGPMLYHIISCHAIHIKITHTPDQMLYKNLPTSPDQVINQSIPNTRTHFPSRGGKPSSNPRTSKSTSTSTIRICAGFVSRL